ncbi:unnamed protein product [Alternaria alternata]
MAGTRWCGAPKPSLPTTSKPTTLTPQARRTFQESFDSFEKTVQRYSRTDDREFSNTTLRDVRDAAKEVERQLAARQCMRNMKRLEPFLNGLEAYSKVIEVLCNGTPFLSWIWLATDHISAFEKLLSAYSQIAAMLPRFDRLGAALQDKPDFQQALAVVYSDILTFHEHAYKLFKRNGWMCFFKSSWGQFGSRFNCILESLEKHATLIDQEANAYLVLETMQWRREALQAVAKTEKDRSTAQLTAALAWLGLETVPHCGQAYQDNLLHRLINDCCDGTTDWILKHQRMRQWLQNGRGGPILWLKGKPGSGKSTLCAKILQFLRAPRQSTVLFCFYSYIVSSTYPDPVVFILATLVSQVLRQRSDLATYVYEEFVAESRPLSIRSLQELLSNLLPQLVMPRILIDGIDECIRYDIHGKPCDLTPVKEVLVSILQLENPMQACAPTKILIVSRDVLELVGKLSKRPTVALDQESDALTADITRYATKCLETLRDRFSNLVGVDNVLKDVKRNVVLKSQGMFLWVRLVLAQLEFDAYNLDDLENAVANMPHSLHDFYSRIVHRIMLYPIQSRERTINILKWMLCSRRPLRVIELQDAIVFASGAVSLSERSKLPPSIVDLCKPLIQADENEQISFVHFTVQEYLTKSNFISLQDAESCTTITCLNYLTFSLNLSNSSISATQKVVNVGRCLYSLQPYVHEHWLDHLLAFAAEVPHSKDRQLEAFLASFFFIYSHQYTRYLDPTDDLQVDVLAAQTLEPRLQHLERYEHHYKFLCAYVVYRHAKQMHFEDPADYREPLDPTPLSVVQLEYATQIDYLLLARLTRSPSESMQQDGTTAKPHHFVDHYLIQQLEGKIPNGWQQDTPPEERGPLAFRLFTQYCQLRPETAEVKSMRAVLLFEKKIFESSITKDAYVSEMKEGLSIQEASELARVPQQIAAQRLAVRRLLQQEVQQEVQQQALQRSEQLPNTKGSTNQSLQSSSPVSTRMPGSVPKPPLPLPPVESGFPPPPPKVAPILAPHVSEQIRLKVYEFRNDDWFDRGTGICHGRVISSKIVTIVVLSEVDQSQLLLETGISNKRFQKQQDSFITWIEENGIDMGLSFQDTEHCARIWNFVKGVQFRFESGMPLLALEFA